MNSHLKKKITKSKYLQLFPVGKNNVLVLHLVSNKHLVIRKELASILESFSKPITEEQFLRREISKGKIQNLDTVRDFLKNFLKLGFLVSGTTRREELFFRKTFSELYGRDPKEGIKSWLKKNQQGQHKYWGVSVGREFSDFKKLPHEFSVLSFGYCDLQMTTDILRDEARKFNISLDILTTHLGDIDLVIERKHDFILLGALPHRYSLEGDFSKSDAYINGARHYLQKIRKRTKAPILINNLPTPSLSPLGLADQGPESHINRIRQINIDLAKLVCEFSDVWICDIDLVFSNFGKIPLLDDSLVSFSHLGSLRWIEQQPKSEMITTHGVFPKLEQLDAFGKIETYSYERLIAKEQLNQIVIISGIDRKKCVIVDLDNTLWPGILAETGTPFKWDPTQHNQFSYVGFYFGLHEALKKLKERGILLVCVSKNDFRVVEKLWKYPDGYPKQKLLTLADFACHRINWNEKTKNIIEIAKEINVPTESMVFLDDHPLERAKIRKYLPEVLVLDENPFLWRRTLLTHPLLQVTHVTKEASQRTKSVQQQVKREAQRRKTEDPIEFLRSLRLQVVIEEVKDEGSVARVHELVTRTNQFNTTGVRFSKNDLSNLVQSRTSKIYSMRLKDVYCNYGLVAACITKKNEISLFVMSCRVLGIGAENILISRVLLDLQKKYPTAIGVLRETDRNIPARKLFPQNGFKKTAETSWLLDLNTWRPSEELKSIFQIKARF